MKKHKYLLMLLTMLATVLFAACGQKQTENVAAYKTPDDFAPIYYLSEAELPNDMYYIVRTETETQVAKDGTETEIEVTKYYPIYAAVEKNFTDVYESSVGFNSNRIMWVNYNVDEGLIPTMYPGDKMIYKSATYIPTKYALEKFFDNGYTLGVCGLTQDLSSNYRYYSAKKDSNKKGHTMTTSDAVGFDGLEATSIYFVALGELGEVGTIAENATPASYERVSPVNVSLSGTIAGLKLMNVYACDIRTGTEKIAANLTCNVHYFSSAENYMFGSFSFITEHIAEIHIPDYVTTGYYNMNGVGMFRYLKDETDYKSLQASDYNKTIYTYNEEGRVDGTTIGLIFDQNSFLVASELIDNFESVDGMGNTYDQYIESQKNPIKNKTVLKADEYGYYTGDYEFIVVSEPTISDKNNIYEIKAVNTENYEVIMLKYTQKSGKETPQENEIYTVIFTEPEGLYDGYIVSSMTCISNTGSQVIPETNVSETIEIETELETETEINTGTES